MKFSIMTQNYSEILSFVMLSVIILNIVPNSVVMLCVMMLNVVAQRNDIRHNYALT
jgi:hypothetical protein